MVPSGGYEIKSDRDTLARLPNQIAAYELCFDTMTMVVGKRHLAKCRATLPEWWGIWEAVPTEKGINRSNMRGLIASMRAAASRLSSKGRTFWVVDGLLGKGAPSSAERLECGK
jgi:hypothetical protein